jgi:hypothetical protein
MRGSFKIPDIETAALYFNKKPEFWPFFRKNGQNPAEPGMYLNSEPEGEIAAP